MSEKSERELVLLKIFVVAAVFVWTALHGTSLAWNIIDGKKAAVTLARQAARAYYNKDKAFRFWGASHGGIYVPVSKATPPNPNLAHVPERDLVTPSGRRLTLMNPAYMLRQLMEQYSEFYGVRGKITSLKSLNPANAPDAWERAALEDFEQGAEEVMELAILDGADHLRLISPLFAEDDCLKCHAHQGYRGGEVRGAVGVSVPMAPYWKIYRERSRGVILFHLLLWGAGMGIIFFLHNRLRQGVVKRNRLELERESLHRQMLSILNTLREGVISVDSFGKATFVNTAALALTGYDREELLGTEIHARLHHSRKDGSRYPSGECPHCRTAKTGQPFVSSDEVFWKKNGASFPVEIGSIPMEGDDREAGAVLTFRDISVEKEKEEMGDQLRQAQKLEAIGTLAGGIAHDFNNILTMILGYADLVKETLPPGEASSEDIQQVIAAGNRAKDLVRQILTFSRKSQQELQPLRLQPVLKESLKLLRASIPSTIEIRQEIDPECGDVLADPTQIHQVIMNLCTNAYHAMREKGGILEVALVQVELGPEDIRSKSALTPGRYARLSVSDTGSGIAPQVVERIFEPYFTTKAKGEGTGLGLSIVHGIVKAAGGEITVYSEVGRGTTFHLYLPLISGLVDSGVVSEPREIPRGNERIMIVDDEGELAFMLAKMIASLGYSVRVFTDSREALAAFQAGPDGVDLLLSDMTMPHLTGVQLTQQCLALRADLPVILCTGFSEALTGEKAKMLGVRELLMKPVLKKDIGVAIRRVLDNE